MGLLEQAKKDIEQITTNLDGFGLRFEISIKADSEIFVEAIGTTARHFMSFDTDGIRVSSKNVHVSVSEKTLLTAGVVVRNSGHEVDLLHRVIRITHSSGNLRYYVVNEQYPDETVGLIVLILGTYIPQEGEINPPTL
tara:strand:- start:115 stop:528 length:414 start_codon:yes stop_codon:yes gene_type:complete